MLRSLTIAAGVAALSLPADAEYYIVHGPDRHCRVVERFIPGDHEIAGALSFSDRGEAERLIEVVCGDNGHYRDGDRM